jgi:hypothetical protein
MKKMIILTICLALALGAGVAIAKRVVTDTGYTLTGQIGTSVACIPGDSNSYPVIFALGLNGIEATNDLTIYEGDNGVLILSAAKAAASTTVKFTGGSTADDGDYFVLQNADGSVFEVLYMSDINLTSGTCTATQSAWAAGTKAYEMKSLGAITDYGATDINWFNSVGLFGGAKGKPMLLVGSKAASIAFVTGGYE